MPPHAKPHAILPSHRAGLFYLEHCRVLMRDDRVEYAVDHASAGTYFWNIPTGNTTIILLGSGTSLTQAAARRLSEDGVMVAFVGGGGTPLFLASQSEYRPTEYCQGWLRQWDNTEQRLNMARFFHRQRDLFVRRSWARFDELKTRDIQPHSALDIFLRDIAQADNTSRLMEAEARCAKRLYALLARPFEAANFTREHGKRDESDAPNSFLDHGNYLAYGLAGVVLWALGIPHALPVSHGMTRRGALVFDVADLIKDGIIMPLAFICAQSAQTDQQFRARCIQELQRLKALEFMFDIVKQAALGQINNPVTA